MNEALIGYLGPSLLTGLDHPALEWPDTMKLTNPGTGTPRQPQEGGECLQGAFQTKFLSKEILATFPLQSKSPRSPSTVFPLPVSRSWFYSCCEIPTTPGSPSLPQKSEDYSLYGKCCGDKAPSVGTVSGAKAAPLKEKGLHFLF